MLPIHPEKKNNTHGIAKGRRNYDAFSSLQAVFIPAVPLFEEAEAKEEGGPSAAGTISGSAEGGGGAADEGGMVTLAAAAAEGGVATTGASASVCLGVGDANAFLGEERRSLGVKVPESGHKHHHTLLSFPLRPCPDAHSVSSAPTCNP